MEVEARAATFAGHRIAYRVTGNGPAMVLVKQQRVPKVLPHIDELAERFRVIQIEPLGFGTSDRPCDYPAEGLHEQVLAVLDKENVNRFAVWGYSQGGCMAAVVAQGAPKRVAAMIAGGSALAVPTDAWIRRMDRERRVPIAARRFWHWFKRFDWLEEVAAMPCPRLVYIGTEDRGSISVFRRRSPALAASGVTVTEFEGLDHQTCNSEPALSARVVPTVVAWLGRVGSVE